MNIKTKTVCSIMCFMAPLLQAHAWDAIKIESSYKPTVTVHEHDNGQAEPLSSVRFLQRNNELRTFRTTEGEPDANVRRGVDAILAMARLRQTHADFL